MSVIAYIGLGSNMGDRKANCLKAVGLLGAAGSVRKRSSFYCTEPVGFKDQGEFVNAVVELATELSPQELLSACSKIEQELGRTRELRWGPRTIDLDILLYGNETVRDAAADLTIPHPLLAERRFVLVPLAEIAPDTVHPVQGRSIKQLLAGCANDQRVIECDP